MAEALALVMLLSLKGSGWIGVLSFSCFCWACWDVCACLWPQRTSEIVTLNLYWYPELTDLHFSSFESMSKLSVCNFIKIEKIMKRNKRCNQITNTLEQFYFLGDSKRKKNIQLTSKVDRSLILNPPKFWKSQFQGIGITVNKMYKAIIADGLHIVFFSFFFEPVCSCFLFILEMQVDIF